MTTVYLTRHLSDMTEGRGPMRNDLCFSTEQLAKDYIDHQPGVMGRRSKWSEERYADWDVVKIEVQTELPFNLEEVIAEEAAAKKEYDEMVRRKALQKLSAYEKEILGIK